MERFTLVGIDGNAFSVMGYTAQCMKRAGFSREEIDRMYDEAKSGDYNNLICVCDDYVEKCNEKLGLEDEEY